MIKDAERYRETGGWGFDRFLGENQTQGAEAELRAKCFACHSKVKDNDFVFTKPRK